MLAIKTNRPQFKEAREELRLWDVWDLQKTAARVELLRFSAIERNRVESMGKLRDSYADKYFGQTEWYPWQHIRADTRRRVQRVLDRALIVLSARVRWRRDAHMTHMTTRTHTHTRIPPRDTHMTTRTHTHSPRDTHTCHTYTQ